jgi:sodium transport system permease protein
LPSDARACAFTGPDFMTANLSPDSQSAGRIRWRQVGIIYAREMRAARRERNIVINSIVLPIVLYPFIMWAVFSGIMFVQGQTAGFQSRIVVPTWPAGHPELRERIMREERIQVASAPVAPAEVERAITDGRLDAWIEFLPPNETAAALADNFSLRITFDRSKDRSATARDRIDRIVERYRTTWLARLAEERGATPGAWQQFTLAERNVASPKQTGAFILGLMLPLFFVIMVAMGAFHPAVDAIAGERERHTWETLITTSANRATIVTAKYLYVTSLGGLAGVLNLAAMTATIGPIFGPMLSRQGGDFQVSIPWAGLPLLALAAVLLAGFVAAGMMIFASFARSFKEGQAMIMPFYLAIMLPVMFLQTPGLTFSPGLACIPVVNVVMLIRSVIAGVFPPVPIAITLVVSAAVIAASLHLAAYIMKFEDVMVGAYSGNFRRFLRERVLRRAPNNLPARS